MSREPKPDRDSKQHPGPGPAGPSSPKSSRIPWNRSAAAGQSRSRQRSMASPKRLQSAMSRSVAVSRRPTLDLFFHAQQLTGTDKALRLILTVNETTARILRETAALCRRMATMYE
jgi:hypothetical protein